MQKAAADISMYTPLLLTIYGVKFLYFNWHLEIDMLL
jgi:hypothetical protein